MVKGNNSGFISNFTRDTFKGKRIIVWGDFILDEYIVTSTGRVSREAPVLVTEYEESGFMLGGAGNVVNNIKSLGAEPIPVGFIGSDEDGDRIKKFFSDLDIDTNHLLSPNNFRTPRKSRILSGRDDSRKQQVLRIDYLNKLTPKVEFYRKLSDELKSVLRNADLLLVSDYLKESVRADLFSDVINEYPKLISVVDSRDNLSKFKNASYVTPNEPEIKNLFPTKRFTSKEDFFDAGSELMSKLNCRGILQKRGNKTMIVFEEGTSPVEIDNYGTSDIVDVTGAGDTVISVLSLSLASGAGFYDSAVTSNIGASIVVMKEGAYPLNGEELSSEVTAYSSKKNSDNNE